MTREDWTKVDAALHRALDLDASAREAFLRDALENRPDLIEEALLLLQYNSAAETAVDLPLLLAAGDWTGRRAGAYRIAGKAGEGGMGVVWRARRDDGQFDREVAIKFLQALAPDALTLDRFLKERDILARLDHPNIARLLDAGFAGEGVRQPFLVLDWVDGKPIDVYAREAHLGLHGTLALFRQACTAVDYAHRQLVVHRDIKPANVLVTAAGEVKLLDFGVAKLLDAGGQSNPTATFARALTPDYSSPEQLRGEPASTLDDVYSLGVLLYELLTGKRPFDLASKTLGEIVVQSGARTPARPSAVREGIPQDLDAVMLKALRPEASERYGSVAEFAADVDRFLDGRPVAARPASAWYAARKFVRRHRFAVAAAGIAALLVGASVVVALRERNRAQERFEGLRKLARSVIFEYQSEISRLPGTLAVRQKMVRNSLTFLDSLAPDARNDPRLLYDIASGYHYLANSQGKPSVANLGDFVGALESARKSLDAFDRLLILQPGHFDAACEKGDLLFDMALIQQRVPPQDSQATQRQAIQYWEDLAAKYPDRERALRGAASALFYKRDFEGSLQLYEQLAARFPGSRGYDHDIALLCRSIAGRLNQQADDPDSAARARQFAERAIRIDEARVATAPLDRGARLDLTFDLLELAAWNANRHQYRETVPLLERSESIRAELVRLSPEDEQAKDRLLYVWLLLGERYAMLGQREKAAAYFKRLLTLGDTMRRPGQSGQPFEKWVKRAKAGLSHLHDAAPGRAR